MKTAKDILTPPQKAVLYCRVSSTRQKVEGQGLDSQEHRCRQHAADRGYEVAATFPDDASGGGDFMKRSGMVALLSYLDAFPHERFVVVFDDLKRFARDRKFHFELKEAFHARNAKLECLNYQFDDTPEGEFVETVFAAQNQLEREQNRRQVIQKMRARVERGYYVFYPPVGFRYEKDKGGGKILTHDEPNASLVNEAFEGLASGRFQTASEVRRFWNLHATMRRKSANGIALNTTFDALRNPLYAGYMNIKQWGLHMHKGVHTPIVSFGVWKKAQDRLDGRSMAPARVDLNTEFPLRGAVCCASCEHPMTAAFSKGRNALYGYYSCYQKSCDHYRKSIRREKMESEFEALLSRLRPAPGLMKLAQAIFETLWNKQAEHAKDRGKRINAKVRELENKTAKLVERVVEVENSDLIKAYEAQLAKIELEKLELMENAVKSGGPLASFETVFRTALKFLSNPHKIWDSGSFIHRRMVLQLTYPQGLFYCKENGFRTAGIAMPFGVLGQLSEGKLGMVEGTEYDYCL